MHVPAVIGTSAIQTALETAAWTRDPAARPGAVRIDDVVLQDAVMALLAVELPGIGHKPHTVEYVRASEAALSVNPAQSLVHLERAILDHPMSAEAAMRVPAFTATPRSPGAACGPPR